MRKLMVLAAMLAMALVVASPAMANTSVIAGDGDNGFGNNGFGNNGFGDNGFDDDFVFVDSSQEQFALQVSTGDAIASDGSVAFSSVDQSVDQSQFNAGFDGFDGDSDDDGIFDEFDFVILAGDFDNNGIQDDFEF